MTELKHRLRRLLASAGFLAGLAVLLWGLHILTVPYHQSADAWRGYRSLEPDSIDVLIVGNSHAFTSIAPFQLWDEKGLTAWHLGSSSINSRMKLAYVQQALEYNSPRIVALEVHRMTQTPVMEDQVNKWAYSHMPFGWSRLSSIMDTAEARQIERYVFPLVGNHQRYESIEPYAVVRNAGLVTDPTTGGVTILSTPPPPKGDIASTADTGAATPAVEAPSDDWLYEQNLTSIKAVAELCRAKDVELLLWVAPVQGDYRGEADPILKLRSSLSGDYPEVQYLNLNLHEFDTGITEQDYRDSSHLYAWGMKKATTYFGEYLVDTFPELATSRHDAETTEKWDSWAGQWNPPSTLQPAPAE